MQPIDNFDLRLFDLNLLVAFDALMSERSVTKAAKRMRVGQPAMSHSLATLRILLQDELLVRVGNVMEPTHRARLVHERVVEGLATLQGAVRLSETFEPAREERTFRLGYSSDVELVLMPRLSGLLRAEAPGIRIVGHLVGAREAERLLDDGQLDLALGCFTPRGSRFRMHKLYEQELCCLWHPDQINLCLPLTRERYLAVPHVAVTLDDNLRGCLDQAVSATSEVLNVVAASAQFLSVLAIVASTPVIATLPSGVARLHAPRFGLRSAKPPLDLALPPISLLWSVRLDLDPGAMWLRDRVSGLLGSNALNT
jgi:DNA-binding transcriptional LysR family regulator